MSTSVGVRGRRAQNWSANITASPYGESATCTLRGFASTNKQLDCSQKDMNPKMNSSFKLTSFTIVYLLQSTLRNVILLGQCLCLVVAVTCLL